MNHMIITERGGRKSKRLGQITFIKVSKLSFPLCYQIVVTKMSVTKLLIIILSLLFSYQIVGYQIVGYKIVGFQIVCYQIDSYQIGVTKNPPVDLSFWEHIIQYYIQLE